LSDENLILDLPKVQLKRSIIDVKKDGFKKKATEAQKDLRYEKNIYGKFAKKAEENIVASCSRVETVEKGDFSQCTGNRVNAEWHENGNIPNSMASPNLNYKRDAQYAENSVNSEWHENGNFPNSMASLNLNYKQGPDFERYVVQKLHHLELKISQDISNLGKRILEKITNNTVEPQEKDNIDIFQDLPLKDENGLETMERKLGNNLAYRKEMV